MGFEAKSKFIYKLSNRPSVQNREVFQKSTDIVKSISPRPAIKREKDLLSRKALGGFTMKGSRTQRDLF